MRKLPSSRTKISTLVLLISLPGVNQSAKSEGLSDLLNMSLNELMNVRVSVASQKNEHLLKSPGIVSTFTRQEMESMGLRSLTDLLSFFPGFVVNEQLAGSAAVQIRGLSDTRNQKILFLLDETPYWFASNGDIPLLGIPISLIDKVEVIRGPGSVIYGTNATAGVVKIVTRKSIDKDASFEAGANQTLNLHGYIGGDNQNLAYQFYDSDGYNGQVNNANVDIIGNTEDGKIPFYKKSSSAYTSFKRKNFSGFLSAFKSEESGGYFGSIRPFAKYINKAVLANTTYQKTLDAQELNIALDLNHYTREQPTKDMFVLFGVAGDGSSEFVDDNDNYRWRFNAQLRKEISANHTVIYGIETERRSTSTSLIKDDANGANLPPAFLVDPRYDPRYKAVVIYKADDVSEHSAYLQSDYEQNKIRLLAGIRYTDNSRSGHKYLPGLAAVYQLSTNQSIKALYSVGFNSPTFRQQSEVGASAVTRTSPLEAEIVRSYDLAYVYSGKQSFFVTNMFYIQARNIIENVNGVFENSGDFDRAGYELDYQYAVRKRQKLFANLSYLHQGNESKSNDQSAIYASKYTVSLGYKQVFLQNHCMGVSMQYLGERKNVNDYTLVNFNYTYEQKNYEIYFLLDNVLDESIEHPDLRTISTSDITLQARDGRYTLIGYRHKF